jgi:predicted HD superfamily hydrolase involved in NAD metabolism
MLIDFDKYTAIIESRLRPERFKHSLNVADCAAKLAEKYGADADKARLAGILHDITKQTPLEEQYGYIISAGGELSKLELNNPSVIHQKSGEAYCRTVLGIDDRDVLGAIRYHTTGRRGMTLLERIVYTADFISADRNYPDVDKMRALAAQSLEDAMIYSLKFTINKLVGETQLIHPDTLECYNYLLEKRIKD